MSFTPTAEQVAILEAVKKYDVLKINAYAGSGKSSTLALVAKDNQVPSLYLAFNKTVADEAKSKFPSHVDCRTIHSMAYAAYGRQLHHKLSRSRGEGYVNVAGTPSEIAKFYSIQDVNKRGFVLKARVIATLVKETVGRFQNSADLSIEKQHVPKKTLTKTLEDNPEVNKDDLITQVLYYADRLWKDRIDVNSVVLAEHDTYLKMWHLSNPTMDYDIIYLDESNDSNAITLDLIEKQTCKKVYVGDNFQCVKEDTIVNSTRGDIAISELQVGDCIKSYRKGVVVFAEVTNKVKSNKDCGVKITTKSGKVLEMTNNHRLYVSDFNLKQGQHLVYMMWRSDLGFRVGKTNKFCDGDNYLGSRPFHEGAQKLWILGIYEDNEEALEAEYSYSLQYGIPTYVYNAESRGINPQRVKNVFKRFGNNGEKLLKDKEYSFKHPHWSTSGAGSLTRGMLRISLRVQCVRGNEVAFEWTEGVSGIKWLLESHGVIVTDAKKDDRYRVRKIFRNYTDALSFCEFVEHLVGNAYIDEYMIGSNTKRFSLMTASGVFAGSKVFVNTENGVIEDEVISVEQSEGSYYDIEVEGTANFFGNDILSHNCIYGWRGAVNAMEKIKAEERVLSKSFRFGQDLADFANYIINPSQPVVGFEKVDTKIGQVTAKKYTHIFRTNGGLLDEAINLTAAGVTCKADIDTRKFESMLRSAIALRNNDQKNIKDELITMYNKWEDLVEEAEDSPELKRIVLIINSGKQWLYLNTIAKMKRVPKEYDVLLITGHKSKGLEWDDVIIADDFATDMVIKGDQGDGKYDQQEVNLFYVACTRAMGTLQIPLEVYQAYKFNDVDYSTEEEYDL